MGKPFLKFSVIDGECIVKKNKTNHHISSNSYPSATADKAIHNLK